MKFTLLFIFFIFISLINLNVSVISNANINGVPTNAPLNANKINAKSTPHFGNSSNFLNLSKRMFTSFKHSSMPLTSISSKGKNVIPHAIAENGVNKDLLPWQLTFGYECLKTLALGYDLIFNFSVEDGELEMYKKAGSSLDKGRRKLFLKYLHSSNGTHPTMTDQIIKIFNIISNKDIESDIGIDETKYPKVVSHLCCWAMTIYLANTLFSLSKNDKNAEINIVNTVLLLKMITIDKQNEDIIPQIKKTGLFVIKYMKEIFPFQNFYDGEFLKAINESEKNIKECFDDECIDD